MQNNRSSAKPATLCCALGTKRMYSSWLRILPQQPLTSTPSQPFDQYSCSHAQCWHTFVCCLPPVPCCCVGRMTCCSTRAAANHPPAQLTHTPVDKACDQHDCQTRMSRWWRDGPLWAPALHSWPCHHPPASKAAVLQQHQLQQQQQPKEAGHMFCTAGARRQQAHQPRAVQQIHTHPLHHRPLMGFTSRLTQKTHGAVTPQALHAPPAALPLLPLSKQQFDAKMTAGFKA